jgi:hypothetical protein
LVADFVVGEVAREALALDRGDAELVAADVLDV